MNNRIKGDIPFYYVKQSLSFIRSLIKILGKNKIQLKAIDLNKNKSMPRQSREVFAGLPYHIVQRGNYRLKIFDDDSDKLFYLINLHNYLKPCKVKLYSWCLMDNHVHLIVEPEEVDSLSQLFRRLNVKYSHYIHKKRGKKGRLWEDRFYSSCLDEQYFLVAIKYVELNPLRANMENELGEYRWSSFHERTNKTKYSILSPLPDWLIVDSWRKFIYDGLSEEELHDRIRKYSKRSLPIGSDDFVGELETKTNKNLRFTKQGRPSV